MDMTRRNLLGMMGAGTAALALPGCFTTGKCAKKRHAQAALQLYSIRKYIAKPEVGLAKALMKVSAIGYKGVEFAGYYKNDAATLKKMLGDAGLKACGTHIDRSLMAPDKIAETCEFNLAYGNNLLICPGGGNTPPGWEWTKPGKNFDIKKSDEFIKRLAEFYNQAALEAAKYGCRIGLHNHMWEFWLKMEDGTSFWDYFFSNTADNVCMEQDVGWTVYAGEDPCEQFRKYPHRSPTLHAKENGSGKNFNAILGQTGDEGAVGVDWDAVIETAEKNRVDWFVVECERHFDSLAAVLPSYDFLHSKGIE